MEIAKHSLIAMIKSIDGRVSELLNTIKLQEQKIEELEMANNDLQLKHQKTLHQIKEYIKELEQIRSHYVDSHVNNQ